MSEEGGAPSPDYSQQADSPGPGGSRASVAIRVQGQYRPDGGGGCRTRLILV